MSKIDREELLELLDTGLTKADCARWFGVTRWAVSQALLPGKRAEQSTTPHVEGAPVSRSTYVNRKCRCTGCRKANAEARAAAR